MTSLWPWALKFGLDFCHGLIGLECTLEAILGYFFSKNTSENTKKAFVDTQIRWTYSLHAAFLWCSASSGLGLDAKNRPEEAKKTEILLAQGRAVLQFLWWMYRRIACMLNLNLACMRLISRPLRFCVPSAQLSSRESCGQRILLQCWNRYRE
jgi:hypothetical protein